MYWGYLDSVLWGAVTEHSVGRYVFGINAVSWTVNLEGGTATRQGKRFPCEPPPREFHGLLYLPAQLVAAITGWEVEADVQERTLRIALPEQLRQRLDAIAKLGAARPFDL